MSLVIFLRGGDLIHRGGRKTTIKQLPPVAHLAWKWSGASPSLEPLERRSVWAETVHRASWSTCSVREGKSCGPAEAAHAFSSWWVCINLWWGRLFQHSRGARTNPTGGSRWESALTPRGPRLCLLRAVRRCLGFAVFPVVPWYLSICCHTQCLTS